MIIVDANVVLRYLLADIEYLYRNAKDIIENKPIYLPNEILAEIVYVLEKVYLADRKEISDTLINLLKYKNISTYDSETANNALSTFSGTKLDFVDTLLFAYANIRNSEIITFDKELLKCINRVKPI